MENKLNLNEFLKQRKTKLFGGTMLAVTLLSMNTSLELNASETNNKQEVATYNETVSEFEGFEGLSNHFVVMNEEDYSFTKDGVTYYGDAWTDVPGNRISVNLFKTGKQSIKYYTYSNSETPLATSYAYVLRDTEINLVANEDGYITEEDVLKSVFADDTKAINDINVQEFKSKKLFGLGTHEFTLVEPGGKTQSITVNVLEEDTESPVVTINKLSSNLNYTGKYNPLDGITITDNVDYNFNVNTDVTVEGRKVSTKIDESEIEWDLTLDDISTQTGDNSITDSVGEYEIRYTVEDSSGNVGGLSTSSEVENDVVATRTVYNNVYIDTSMMKKEVRVGNKLDTSGIEANEINGTGAKNEDVTGAVSVDNASVNTAKAGTYSLDFNIDYNELGTDEEFTNITSSNDEIIVNDTVNTYHSNGKLKSSTKYNSNGQRVSVTNYNDNGVKTSFVKYDTSTGKVDNKTWYNTSGVKTKYEEWTNGKKVSLIQYNGKAVKSKTFYNTSGKRTSYETWASGKRTARTTYNVKTGKAVEKRTYHTNGKTKQKTDYNSVGKREVVNNYNTSGKRTTRYAYNTSNNKATTKHTYNTSNGKVTERVNYHTNSKVKQKTTYDKNGKREVVNNYNAKGQRTTRYAYNVKSGKVTTKHTYYTNGKVKTKSNYNSKGKVSSKYDYSTKGKITKKTTYKSNGKVKSVKNY